MSKTQPTSEAEAASLLVDANQVAELLDVSIRHVRRLHAAGRLPKHVLLGSSVRWVRSTVEAWTEDGCPDPRIWEANRRNRSPQR